MNDEFGMLKDENNHSALSIQHSALKVPDIRFKGFSGEWEEKTLGEIGSLKNGMNFDKSAMGHGHPFVNLQDVFGKNEVSDKNLGLAYSTENQRKDYCLNEGDVLFIRSSVKPDGVGEAAVVPQHMANTTYSGFIIRFRPNLEMDVNFNRFVYSTANSRKQILASSTSSANSNINQDSLQRIQLALPCKPEQTAIGTYFQKLDSLINQHQQKHDKLSNIKKAMLEKMFPKQGETIPEIRFQEFSGEWEESVLGAISEITTGKLDANAMIANGKYDFYTSGIKKYRIDIPAFEGPAITVAGNGATVGYMHLADGKFNAYQRTYVLTNFKANRYFLFCNIGKALPSKINQEVRAGNIPYIVLDMLTDLEIKLPSEKDEQAKIGNYFQKLDALINQHQQQITKLNNIKQACLSKMFV